MNKDERHELMREVTKKLIEEGKLIEAGFVALKMIAMDKQASAAQISDMRIAFFAGVHHVFSSIMTTLDEGAEPTEADLKHVKMIHEELDKFVKQFKRTHVHLTGKGPFQ
jgi:hypothetical protein